MALPLKPPLPPIEAWSAFVIPSEGRDLAQGDKMLSSFRVIQAALVRSFGPLRMTPSWLSH
jgi:hypothetical protein